MSKELVYREDLIKKIFPYGMPDGGNYGISARAVMEAVMGVDAVDVVAVVRCENCTRGDPTDSPEGRLWCTKICRYMKLDGFCSFGDPKKTPS